MTNEKIGIFKMGGTRAVLLYEAQRAIENGEWQGTNEKAMKAMLHWLHMVDQDLGTTATKIKKRETKNNPCCDNKGTNNY